MATTGAQLDEVAARRRIVPTNLNGSPAVVIADTEDTKKELKIVSSRMKKIPQHCPPLLAFGRS